MTVDEGPDRLEQEARQAKADLQFATVLTRAMRKSDGRGWRDVRERLAAEGIDPQDAAVGILFSGGPGEFGVLATREGRSFKFDVNGIERVPPTDFLGEGRVGLWKELDGSPPTYAQDIAVARRVLGL